MSNRPYKEVVLDALSIPHTSLSIDEIHLLTDSHHGASVIRDLREDGIQITDVKLRNPKSKKFYNKYFIGRRF